MPKDSIFLSTESALAAVCRDLRQYEPQLLLISELLRILPYGPGAVLRETGANGVWIQDKGSNKMRWLEGVELVEFTCRTLAAANLDAHALAPVCRRVFRSRSEPEVDPETGEAGIRIETGMEGFACRQCGACCRRLNYSEELTETDLQRWRDEGRHDILEWVGTTTNLKGERIHRMWIVPGTCRIAEKCPFLTRVSYENRWKCSIQDTKPKICRSYPMSRKHALLTGCPGFNKPPNDK
jgi:Fe-S-cluster containining protein